MAKKYLTLEEAAKRLGITPVELSTEREAGVIRGFANRGSWKFRQEDIDEFARTRETDSSPEIPLDAIETEKDAEADLLDASDSDVKLYSHSSLFDEDGVEDLSASDSDVRLTGDSGPTLESNDSSETDDSVLEFDNDSEASLSDSDSDVKMAGGDPGNNKKDPDSGITLGSADDDSGISLDISDSGISLEGVDSNFAADSGISLEVGDSGISLESGDSGISLDADHGSGISLETDDSGITTAMVPPVSADQGDETQQMDMKEAELGLQDSSDDAFTTGEFDLGLLDAEEQDAGTDTSILMFDDDGATDTDMEFSSVDEEFADEESFQDDEFGDDFEDDMDDVFEADDEEEFESGQSQVGFETLPPPGTRGAEAPWGTGVALGVVGGSVFSAVGAFAGFELVRTMWMWFQPGTGESGFLKFLGGFFV
ncbi:MAG: helix-turn-helix domain-containing protein [Fuerstiella sp.]|nr:helix-turn-helix domain-containing protein [Fuerstiella sp.]